MHSKTELCLQTELWMLIVAPCDLTDERQRWVITSFEEYKRNLLLNVNKIDRGNP